LRDLSREIWGQALVIKGEWLLGLPYISPLPVLSQEHPNRG